MVVEFIISEMLILCDNAKKKSVYITKNFLISVEAEMAQQFFIKPSNVKFNPYPANVENMVSS